MASIPAAIGQSAADGIRYVAPDGSNSNNGLTWSTAKLNLEGTNGAVASCSTSSGSCVVHVAAAGISMSNNLLITQKQVTIQCEPGAVITGPPSGNGPAIVLEANDTRVTGCAFDYTSDAAASAVEVAAASSASVQRVTIDNNLFENYPGSAAAVIVGDRTNNKQSGIFVTDINVTDNIFWMNLGGDVNIEDNAERIVVSRNRSFTGGSTSNVEVINAQTNDSGTTMLGLTIANNVMFNGLGGDCVQVQQLAGNSAGPIYDLNVSSNVCTLLPPPSPNTTTTGSGYSTAGVIGATIVGNVYDASTNSVQISGGNAPFEFVNVQNGTESGNSAIAGSQSNFSPFQMYTVIANGVASGPTATVANNAFTGNSASIAYADTASGAYAVCWGVGSGGPGTNYINRNTFTGNTCDFTNSSSAAEVVGFYMQGGNTGDQLNYNFVSENNFIPQSSSTSAFGIVLQPESGTATNNIVGFNGVTSFNVPYCSNLTHCATSTGLPGAAVAPLTYGSAISGPNCTPTGTSTCP